MACLGWDALRSTRALTSRRDPTSVAAVSRQETAVDGLGSHRIAIRHGKVTEPAVDRCTLPGLKERTSIPSADDDAMAARIANHVHANVRIGGLGDRSRARCQTRTRRGAPCESERVRSIGKARTSRGGSFRIERVEGAPSIGRVGRRPMSAKENRRRQPRTLANRPKVAKAPCRSNDRETTRRGSKPALSISHGTGGWTGSQTSRPASSSVGKRPCGVNPSTAPGNSRVSLLNNSSRESPVCWTSAPRTSGPIACSRWSDPIG